MKQILALVLFACFGYSVITTVELLNAKFNHTPATAYKKPGKEQIVDAVRHHDYYTRVVFHRGEKK